MNDEERRLIDAHEATRIAAGEMSVGMMEAVRHQLARFSKISEFDQSTSIKEMLANPAVQKAIGDDPAFTKKFVESFISLEIKEREAKIVAEAESLKIQKASSEDYSKVFSGFRLFVMFFFPLLTSAGLVLVGNGFWGMMLLLICYIAMAVLLMKKASLLRDLQKNVTDMIARMRG